MERRQWAHVMRASGNNTSDKTRYEHEFTIWEDGSTLQEDRTYHPDGNMETTYIWESPQGEGKTTRYWNGERVNQVPLNEDVVISADEAGEDDGGEKGSGNSEDGQPGAEGTERPRGGARDVRCDWWGCVDNGVSTPVQTNPGPDTGGSVALGGSAGPGAVTDPTPMDDTTGSGGGGYDDPAPGGNPGGTDGPGTR